MSTFFSENQNKDVIIVNVSGKYYIGDPCYCFSHESNTWDDLCNSWFGLSDSNLATTENNVEAVGIPTAYGDGSYNGNINSSQVATFPVDAGMLGVVPVSFIEGDCTFNKDNSCGVIVELSKGDIIYGENGNFHISGSVNIVITTDDSDNLYTDRYDDDYDDYDDEN